MFKFIALSVVYLGAGNIYIGEEFSRITELVVDNKSDRNRIEKSIADYEKEQKRFEKKLEKALKNFSKSNTGESFSIDELKVFIKGVTQQHSDFIKISIDKQLEIKSLYEDREWNLLIKHYLKRREDLVEARFKREQLFMERIDGLKVVFNDAIQDTVKLSNSLLLLDSAKALTHQLYLSSADIGFIDSRVLSSRISARRDVDKVYEKWLEERTIYDTSLMNLIESLSKTPINKKEWDMILDKTGELY